MALGFVQQGQWFGNDVKVRVLTCVVGSAAVVGGREERDEVTLSEAFEPVHDALMRTDNHLQFIVLHVAQAASSTAAGKSAIHRQAARLLREFVAPMTMSSLCIIMQN